MKASIIATSIAIVVVAGINMKAYAGANDFFGSALGSAGAAASGPVGGSPETQQGGAAIVNQTQGVGAAGASGSGINTNAPGGDYTSDEKRVQKKYRANVRQAQQLIAKGEGMMKSKDEKDAKKGRILKEIGEKRLAELKASNPFPEIAGREPKKLQ